MESYRIYNICIKLPAPSWERALTWGDYHMALALSREFKRRGHNVTIQCFPEWGSELDGDCQAVIVLRGARAYQPKKRHINILWNISHPDRVSIEEYNQYDYVCIASKKWARHMKPILSVPVEEMLQCTDPTWFKPFNDDSYKHEILFVGNTRNIYRKIIRDLLPTQRDLAVYGKKWHRFIESKYIKGSYIANDQLYKYYGSSGILLNDHYDDMRKKGFISNRIFDGLAAGAFIISDNVKRIEKVFGDAVVTYKKQRELAELIEYYLSRPDLRKKKAEEGAYIVLRDHTFSNRVDRFLQIINQVYLLKK